MVSLGKCTQKTNKRETANCINEFLPLALRVGVVCYRK
jgi:hypothetical protein